MNIPRNVSGYLVFDGLDPENAYLYGVSVGEDQAIDSLALVEGWVWCETCKAPQVFHVEDGDYECGRWSDESCGPYHTMLIGPGVTP